MDLNHLFSRHQIALTDMMSAAADRRFVQNVTKTPSGENASERIDGLTISPAAPRVRFVN